MSEQDAPTRRFLTTFGEQQLSRIATRKAERTDAEAGKYATQRYYLALLLELVQIGAFLGAAVGMVFLPFAFSWELAQQTGLNIAALLLARKGAQWAKPAALST